VKPVKPLLGCQWRGIRHLQEVSVEEKFRMLRDSRVYDYLDRLPTPDVFDEHMRCSEKYGIPMLTGNGTYQLGRDEEVMALNIRNAAIAGLAIHNVMLLKHHADGHVLTDQEVVDCYIRMHEASAKHGIKISFEVHVNNWSESYLRVRPVAEAVRSRGLPFYLTLDYSHCIFKIENPAEQELSEVRQQVEAGEVVLDPFEKGSLCEQWLEMEMIALAQFRPAVPNGPRNIWALGEDGQPGRGIQYPFYRPKPGEWHSPWHAWKLEPAKEAIRKVLRHHLTSPNSPLQFMTTEYITLPDYGENARYSLFEHSVAAASWIRDTWNTLELTCTQK